MNNLKGEELKTCNTEKDILQRKPRLQAVRQRALNVLEASQNRVALDQNLLKNQVKMNETNHVKSKSINVSDLVAENTIVLNSPLKSDEYNDNIDNSSQTKVNKENKISFEPCEITGRSTLFKQTDSTKKHENLTIEDILASSFCDDIRRMTLNSKKTSGISSFSSLRTADISAFSKSNDSFQPAELMSSQMLRDELSWENDYLDIPSEAASAQDAAKKGLSLENKVDQSLKTSVDFSNISEVGNFFYKRSDQLESIISSNIISPPKRNPVKLVDSDESFSISQKGNNEDNINSSTLSSKTYTQTPTNKIKNQQKQSYDHTNILTMSAVENVLQQLNLDVLLNAEYKGSYQQYSDFKKTQKNNREKLDKENLSPYKVNSSENDTVTFTESLLDCSNLCNKDTDNSEKSFSGSTLCAIRSSKSVSNLSNIFSNEVQPNGSKKRSRSFNRTMSPEPIPVIASLSSTLLNENKSETNFLRVENHVIPPVSPIRSRNITPKKQQTRNLSPSSLMNSPKFSSPTSSGSLRSPVSLNTTTQSERRYLCVQENKINKSKSPEIKSTNSETKSPSNLGILSQQFTAGSLMSAKSRCNSQCSTTSEFTHRDGQSLPIKATVNQCCFGSIKLRTVVKKTIGIRNISHKRLSFKIGIEGPGFQIDNMENNSIIILQDQECRSISINFCPTVLGAATGRLNFSPPYDGWPIDKVILLQGYGGHASIKVRDFSKGPIGPPYINMGEVQELSQPLIKTFSIHNRGPLSGFALINLNSNGLSFSNLYERIEIEPKRAYLPENSIVKFRLIFKPRRNDIKKILSKVSEVMVVANIRIITGDEPTRQRICNVVKVQNNTPSNDHNELSELTQSKLSSCWLPFPNEVKINELDNFIENSENALELASGFRDWEAVLTITHCLMDNTKSTSNFILPDLDETILFRTMICASSDSKNLKDSIDENVDDRFNELWAIKPNVLQFVQNFTTTSKFTIKSFFQTEQYFEITSNYKNLFNIHPREGQILPGQLIEVQVFMLQSDSIPRDNINIIIYFEKEKINVPVIINRKH